MDDVVQLGKLVSTLDILRTTFFFTIVFWYYVTVLKTIPVWSCSRPEYRLSGFCTSTSLHHLYKLETSVSSCMAQCSLYEDEINPNWAWLAYKAVSPGAVYPQVPGLALPAWQQFHSSIGRQGPVLSWCIQGGMWVECLRWLCIW